MKLDIKINKFIINKNSSIKEALDKINDNSSRIVFIIDENDKLFGSFSDGDFRRWLLTQENIDLSKPITEICNKNQYILKPGLQIRKFKSHLIREYNTYPF